MKLASLGKHLREVVKQVQQSGSGAAIDYFRSLPGNDFKVQGTRADTWQGTSSRGSTANPLNPGQTLTPNKPYGWDDPVIPEAMVFSTDDPAYDGVERTLITTRNWPANPSTHAMGVTPGHTEQMRTDMALDLGPAPGRIERYMPYRVLGIASVGTGMEGSPDGYLGNMSSHDFIPHLPTARQPHIAKGPQKLSDDNAVIPAVYAGNPRP